MFQGKLLAIRVAASAGQPMIPVEQADVLPERGLAGDRYADEKGAFQKGPAKPAQQVTLIEREALDALLRDYELSLTHAETRRNLLTENAPLNQLVGRSFRIGNVVLRGVELCEPCGYLEKLTGKPVQKSLRHRGGLRAEILEGGTIRVGDPISNHATSDRA